MMMTMMMAQLMMAQRQRLLQHISEQVKKYLAPQDDLGSHRQLVNDNLNSLPDHKPNTRLHTLGIFFAHMIALKKMSDYTVAAASAAVASIAIGDPPVSGVTAVVASAAAASDPGMAANSSSADPRTDSNPESWPDFFADEDSSGYFDYYDTRSEVVVRRVVVPSSSSLMSTTSTPTNTAAMAAGLKTTGLEEVFADDGAKVGDDVTAASSLLSLDTLVETAVKSINKGVIPTSLSK